MPAYDLVQTLNPDAPARYSANGRRISRNEYERIMETARRLGQVDCLFSSCYSRGVAVYK